MKLTESYQFIYENFDQEDVDNLFSWIANDAITLIASEFAHLKPKYEEGGEQDTDEFAEKMMLAVVDSLAERIKAEVRIRISKANDIKRKSKEVEEQLK